MRSVEYLFYVHILLHIYTLYDDSDDSSRIVTKAGAKRLKFQMSGKLKTRLY